MLFQPLACLLNQVESSVRCFGIGIEGLNLGLDSAACQFLPVNHRQKYSAKLRKLVGEFVERHLCKDYGLAYLIHYQLPGVL